MTFFVLLPTIYFAAIVQGTIPELFRIRATSPDFLVMTAACWLVVSRHPLAFASAGLIGFAADLTGPGCLGVGAGVWVLIGYLYQRTAPRQAVEMLVWQMCMVALLATTALSGNGMIRWMLDELTIGPLKVLERAVSTGAYTALLSLPVLLLVSWMIGPITPERSEANA